SIPSIPPAITLPIFMFAGGAIGNLIAIIVLSVSRHRQKSSAFYTLVCGLAVTDLLGTCLASPITIANYLDQDVLTDRHLCEFMSFVLLFFSLTGLSIICAMAAERYWAICCPYTYQSWGVDRRFAHRFLLVIYISHIFFCCLPMMGMAQSELQKSQTWCFISWGAAYSVLYGAVSLALILGTILLNLAVCGALLLMRQRTAQRPATRASVRERWRALSSAAETQMIAVLVMTSAVVLACSAPLVVSPKPRTDSCDTEVQFSFTPPCLDVIACLYCFLFFFFSIRPSVQTLNIMALSTIGEFSFYVKYLRYKNGPFPKGTGMSLKKAPPQRQAFVAF
uniref:G-protein coupled receptors family 1 profile domain-containing protein n=1 Tax=Sphaeramia orbicularis TaxID=375764 RepID=A0A673BEF6_9TELE